jgi:hypothetical protein
MTGQVKEELLTRWGELGVETRGGRLRFAPSLLCEEEFSKAPYSYSYVDVSMHWRERVLPAGSLAFTYCQTPVIYTPAETPGISVEYDDGTTAFYPGDALDEETSRAVLGRTGTVRMLWVAPARGTCRGCRSE